MAIRVKIPQTANKPNSRANNDYVDLLVEEARATRVRKIRKVVESGDVWMTVPETDPDFASPAKMFDFLENAQTRIGTSDVEVKDFPCWLKCTLVNAALDVPAYVPVEDVVVTPAVLDQDGNEVTPAVTRRPKYNELRLGFERKGAWYAPASDGQHYFDGSILLQLSKEVGVDIVAAPPEAPEVVE